jgi:hypothetical protein
MHENDLVLCISDPGLLDYGDLCGGSSGLARKLDWFVERI